MPAAFRQAIRSLAVVTEAPTPTLVKIVLKPASEIGVAPIAVHRFARLVC